MTEVDRFDWKPERELAADLLEKIGIPVGPFMRYAEAVYERRTRRVALVLAEAARYSGQTQDDLLGLADGSELGDLLAEVLQAASVARSEAHLRALARVLATAVAGGDEARVDDLHEIVRVLARLTPLDIRALHALERTGPRPVSVTQQLDRPFDVISKELGSSVLASPVESRLRELALLNPGVTYDDGLVHIVTPFGRRVLAYLSEINDA